MSLGSLCSYFLEVMGPRVLDHGGGEVFVMQTVAWGSHDGPFMFVPLNLSEIPPDGNMGVGSSLWIQP
jgi:hypothetical protein